MIDVRKLIVLRAVVAHGSIAAAARELGYTRSAISQQVSALERTAGVALLVRHGKSVSVTPVCRRLLEHTERVLVELRAAEATLRQADGELSGTLHVGIALREGPALMSGALTKIRRQHPKLLLTVAATTDTRGYDEVRYGRLDIAMLSRFGVGPGAAEPGLREWVLGHDALRLCVPCDHRLATRDSCRLEELASEDWVLSPGNPLGRVVGSLCGAVGFAPKVVGTVDDVATALNLVSVGWGITVAPELTPAGPSVVKIPLVGIEACRYSVLVARDGEEHSPEIATVVAAVYESSVSFDFH